MTQLSADINLLTALLSLEVVCPSTHTTRIPFGGTTTWAFRGGQGMSCTVSVELLRH